MNRGIYYTAKVLEGLGLIIVLVGLVLSMELGFREEGLASMRYEMNALMIGGGMFAVGWFIERGTGKG